jgi:hypothetical protein
VVHTSVSTTTREVVSNTVGYAAQRTVAVTSKGGDYVRSLVDYLEGVEAMNLPRSGISWGHLCAIRRGRGRERRLQRGVGALAGPPRAGAWSRQAWR